MGRYDNPGDDYYRCLCNTHVHKGTFIIAIIGIILNVPGLLSIINVGKSWYFAISFCFNVISLLTYISLLIGNRKENPVLYLPYVIVNTIAMICMILFSIFMFVVAGLTFGGKVDLDSSLDISRDGMGAIEITIGVVYIITFVIQAYFLYVVYKGYRYLKDVVLDPSSNVPRVYP